LHGGTAGYGTIFRITPTGTFEQLYSFLDGYGGGCFPFGGLVEGSDGNFYGTTNQCGTGGPAGTVFRISPAGTFTTLHSFSGPDGAYSYSSLVQGSDGYFYGTTNGGGTSGYGTVFRITPTGTLTTLCSFSGSDGASPYAGLVRGSDNDFFYGTTAGGGTSNAGTVFRMTPDGTLTTLHSFSGNDGATAASTARRTRAAGAESSSGRCSG
jgi:uncharacterized repeat protein (TIGR03803 family)